MPQGFEHVIKLGLDLSFPFYSITKFGNENEEKKSHSYNIQPYYIG